LAQTMGSLSGRVKEQEALKNSQTFDAILQETNRRVYSQG